MQYAIVGSGGGSGAGGGTAAGRARVGRQAFYAGVRNNPNYTGARGAPARNR